MNKSVFLLTAAAVVLSACANKSAYELAVEDLEPTYCYRSIGGVACYEEPFHRDERRLVNYFGPAPKRYDKPDPPDPQVLVAPEPIDYWVKDPEPMPQPVVPAALASADGAESSGLKAFLERLTGPAAGAADDTDAPGERQ